MLKIVPPQSQYLPGIIKLHSSFDKAWTEAKNFYTKYIGDTLVSSKRGVIYVDFSQQDSTDMLSGHFVIRGTLLRPLQLNMEMPFFFPLFDYGNEQKYGNISYQQICDLRQKGEAATFSFSQITDESYKLYQLTLRENTIFQRIKDEIGMPYCSFKDVKELKMKSIPKKLLNRDYPFVGMNHYAPFTTSEDIYCILFAQLDNQYDNNAIKVLRWIPEERENQKNFHGDVFFELGYIGRTDNTELHEYMTQQSSRILFGKKQGNVIHLMGSVSMFLEMNLNYPKCLFNIPLS